MRLDARAIVDTTAPYDLVSRMRASFWVVGPLLARMGEARVSLPGGCAIGTRPVDLLLFALERLGAQIDIEAGYVVASAKKGLVGAEIAFPKVTVGGTHTALMAATLASGTTVIRNAAREPEIVDVADCLMKMGAKMKGAGTPVDRGDGRVAPARRASCCRSRPHRDRHLCDVRRHDGRRRGARRGEAGAACSPPSTCWSRPASRSRRPTRASASAATGTASSPSPSRPSPFPGFPTDLQAQLMGLMTRAKGRSRITETIFENRFMHVQELARLGARIHLDGQTATVDGVPPLTGAPVMATDLRASVSLVIAGLAAEGETMVNRVYHLDRGFEGLERKLTACGALIERISGER